MESIINKIINFTIVGSMDPSYSVLCVLIKNAFCIEFTTEDLLVILCKNSFLTNQNKLINVDRARIDKQTLINELDTELQKAIKNLLTDFELSIEVLQSKFEKTHRFKIQMPKLIYNLSKINCKYNWNNETNHLIVSIENKIITNDLLSQTLIATCKTETFPEVIQKLITKGADPNYNNSEALIYCCQTNRNINIIKILLKSGADIKARDFEAIKVASSEILNELLDYM